jgi:flagellum-specific peptidoglycan hydrolase FlgJ
MSIARKAWWQQATALVTVSAGGVITGFNFVPDAATLTTPAGLPLHQLALEQAARPDTAGKATASDAQLRAAIVNVARYYLKLAKTKTPAQLEALIWGEVSSDGTDHGPSVAAFASLTLELAAQTTGLRSWVTGGTTYPWPLPAWADVRVDTNPASPQITAAVPGLPVAVALAGTGGIPGAGPATGNGGTGEPATAAVPGVLATGQLLGNAAASTTPRPESPTSAPVNVRPAPAKQSQSVTPAPATSPSSASSSPKQYAAPGTRNQQAFISLVAPGAVAAQQRNGVPASVTIAQAIEESAWGRSSLAARYHNLFGIKGAGPAGSVTLPTQEYENGSWVTVDAQFAVYRNDAESIAGHAELLATSGYYAHAMADRAYPDAFANNLTGVYATDPDYGANLIALMKLYNLYQYDTAPATTPPATPAPAPSRTSASASGSIPGVAARYQAQLPQAVTTALFAVAKGPLGRGGHLYRDVAATTGGSWKLLAAADWMQCKADPRYSPVQGEKLGTVNADGTFYPTKSAALAQCAADLIELSAAVYGVDLTARRPLSVLELAAAFAAFRWGALLKRHGVSPMEFPYSVAGLTTAHLKMRWPTVNDPGAPDRPGARFRQPFGAVPVALSLGYPATV